MPYQKKQKLVLRLLGAALFFLAIGFFVNSRESSFARASESGAAQPAASFGAAVE